MPRPEAALYPVEGGALFFGVDPAGRPRTRFLGQVLGLPALISLPEGLLQESGGEFGCLVVAVVENVR